jgi:hypothetical protein
MSSVLAVHIASPEESLSRFVMELKAIAMVVPLYYSVEKAAMVVRAVEKNR